MIVNPENLYHASQLSVSLRVFKRNHYHHQIVHNVTEDNHDRRSELFTMHNTYLCVFDSIMNVIFFSMVMFINKSVVIGITQTFKFFFKSILNIQEHWTFGRRYWKLILCSSLLIEKN